MKFVGLTAEYSDQKCTEWRLKNKSATLRISEMRIQKIVGARGGGDIISLNLCLPKIGSNVLHLFSRVEGIRLKLVGT